MKKRHAKTFLSLCAGLILSLCLGSCTLVVDGDVYISGTDSSEATSDSETESSDDDNSENQDDTSEDDSGNEDDENEDESSSSDDPTNPDDDDEGSGDDEGGDTDPEYPDEGGDTPIDPDNPDEGGGDGGDTGDIDPDDPSQGDDPDPDPENPDEGGDDGDDEPNPDDPGSGTNPDPNPDDPESGDEHGDDGDSGSEGGGDEPGDTGGDDPNPDDPGSGTNPDPDPENPDEGDDDEKGDESSEPVKHEYTYSASTTELNANGGSFTYDGLTWTFSEATALSKDSSGRGVQIGASSKVQSAPWTFSTDFEEMVLLESVSARIYTSTGSGLTAHYELTLDSTSLGGSDFHSSKSTDVYVAEGAGLPLYGQILTLSINAVNSTAFYFESISLVYYTNVDSSAGGTGDTGNTGDTGGSTGGDTGDTGGSTGGNTGDTGDTGGSGSTTPDESDDYTYYQDYAYKFAKGDLSSSGGSLTKNGLTWTYDAPTYIGWDGQFKRGIQIGSNGNPQYEPWTFTTSFDETIKLMDVTVYLYTSTSGNANVSISLGEQEIGSEDFNTTGTSSTSVYLAEYTELERLGDSLTISLKANNAQGFYLKAISLHIYTTEETALNLSADSLEDEPYEPAPVVPGENDVLKTNSSYNLTEEDYYTYNSIDWTLTGEELRTSLRDSYSPVTRYSYGDIRYMLPYVDEDPNNEGYMYGAYDGDELPAYWDSAYYDREHVWPCAHMKLVLDDDGDYRPDNDSVGHYSDLHNLRICCKPVNNYKSDKYFYTTNDSYNFFPNESNPSSLGSGSHSFAPAENYNGETGDHRGDVARICLYMYTMYEGLSLEDGVTGSDNPYTFGQLKTLLLWNYEDEPDEFEIQRNNRIYEYQGNRNPFIDYPELADYLFPNETHYFLSY